MLTGSIANPAGGLIRISTGNELLVNSGLAANAGVISLTGGTFDNGGHAIVNTGEISGYGTFASGGLTNNGTVTFGGGTATINGDVLNSAGKVMGVSFGSALFTGNVVNSGTFKITGGSATFAGTFSNTGTLVTNTTGQMFSTLAMMPGGTMSGGATVQTLQMQGGSIATGPSTLVLAGNISASGSAGSISGQVDLGAANRTIDVAGGTTPVNLTVSAGVSNGSITKTGAGTLLLSGSVSVSGLNVNGGTTQLAMSSTIGALTVSGSGAVTLAAHASGGAYNVLDTSSLSIAVGGSIDLWNNAMIVRASGSSQNAANLTAVQAAVNAASNGLLWNGAGIGSTTVFNEASNTQALALMVYDNTVITQSSFEGVSGLGYFNGGNPVGFNQVLVKLTYLGDFNGDGVINASDYTWLDGYALSGIALGDLNGDGVVNATDYTWLDGSALNQSYGVLADSRSGILPLSPATATAPASSAVLAASPEAVPEPGALGLFLTGALGLAGFRRNGGRNSRGV